jgi:DNA-binding MarR family transcriptional regulator
MATNAARVEEDIAESGAVHPRVAPIYAAGELDSVVRRVLRKRLAPLGLTITEFTALVVIEAQPGMSNAQLSRRSFITPQAMNEVLSSLESKGLVERGDVNGHNGNGHHRARAATVSKLGRRRVLECREIVAEIEDVAFAGIADDDMEAFGAIMRQAAHRLRRSL